MHVGQCGLQLGSSFWHQARLEHSQQQHYVHHADSRAKAGKASIGGGSGMSSGGSGGSGSGRRVSSVHRTADSSEWWRWSASSDSSSAPFDDSLSTFFHPVEPSSAASSSLSSFPFRARAVLVDMESGVLSALSRSSQASLFDSAVSVVSDVSGSGNNWAHGYCVFGPQYGSAVLDCVRRQAEQCDSLQAFILSHSTGGGTGSGLGSYILEQLSDCYGGLYRLDQCVLPSVDSDDVVTSPYNAALSLPAIQRSADVVLPFDNQAMVDICDAFHKSANQQPQQQRLTAAPTIATAATVPPPPAASVIGGGFSELNVLCASVLTSLTAGMRFPGELNVDLSDLVMTLCPHTDTNLLVPALSPLHSTLLYHYNNNNNNNINNKSSSSSSSRTATSQSRQQLLVGPAGRAGRALDFAVSPLSETGGAYYFHTVNTAQSLYATQSSARHAASAFGSSIRAATGRGDLDGGRSGRTGSQQEDALFNSTLQMNHQLLQVGLCATQLARA